MTAACTGQQQGLPSAEPGLSVSASSPVSQSSRPTARPAVLPLDGVAPCELVDQPTRQRFHIDRPDAPSATDPEVAVCTLLSSTGGGYVVALERRRGVEALGRAANTTVGGFPAVDIRQSGVRVGHLSIDVADGQRLDIEVQRISGSQPVDEIHQDTMRLAEAVLAALRHRLGR